MSVLSKRILTLIGVVLLLIVGGCDTANKEPDIINDAVEIVDCNLETKKPIVVLKNLSDKNLRDVRVKLTSKDDNGTVVGVREGNFGITTDLAMVPGQQVGMVLNLGNGKFSPESKLTWEIASEITTMIPPKISVLSSSMVIDNGNPVVSGEIRNESTQNASVDMCFDHFRNGKIINSCSAVYADTHNIPPGKIVPFSEKAYFLPAVPDSYQIYFLYQGQ
jgi:hypothetical protein